MVALREFSSQGSMRRRKKNWRCPSDDLVARESYSSRSRAGTQSTGRVRDCNNEVQSEDGYWRTSPSTCIRSACPVIILIEAPTSDHQRELAAGDLIQLP